MLVPIETEDDQKIYDLLIWKRRSTKMIDKSEEESSNVEIIEIPYRNMQNDSELIIVAKLFRVKEPLPGNPIVIFGHGNGEDLDDYIEFNSIFCENGISFCSFDYRGYGYSDGIYGSCSASEREDLITVINYFKKKRF